MIKFRYIPKSNFYVANIRKMKVMFYPVVSSESEKMGVDYVPFRERQPTGDNFIRQRNTHTFNIWRIVEQTLEQRIPQIGLRYYELINDRSQVRIHTSCMYRFLIRNIVFNISNIVFNISLFKRLFVKKLCVCLVKKLKFKNDEMIKFN